MGISLSTFITPAAAAGQRSHPENDRQYAVKVMGPTGAGKSSILLKLNYPETIIDPTNYNPTIACDFVMIRGPRPDLLPTNTNVSQRGLRIACFDTSGAERYAIINSSFLRHTHGIIFVIDSSPRDGQTREQFIDEARRSLLRVISQYANNVQDQPLLVFVNKQDCAGARMTAEEVIESLDLEDMFATDKGVGGDGGERRWFVQEASALRGEGIAMGFAWLLAQMEDRRRTNPAL